MDLIGNYETKPFTKHRKNIVEVLRESKKKHSAYAVIELDVTNGRNIIEKYKEKHSKKISFTGWFIRCVAQAVSEHKELNAYRCSRNKTVIFEDVDMPITVERKINGEPRLMLHIIRKANEKSVMEITNEIRSAQKENIDQSSELLGKKLTRIEKFALSAPSIFQRFILWILKRQGILKKKYMGTVGVTAIGMKGSFNGWAIPLGGIISTLIAIGGITKKPGVVNNKIKIREYLHVTICFDHDIVDGGPVVRFIETLSGLVENGYGLSK